MQDFTQMPFSKNSLKIITNSPPTYGRNVQGSIHHVLAMPNHLLFPLNCQWLDKSLFQVTFIKVKVKINVDCIAPRRERTSKALRYGTRSQGISQFYGYLHIPRSSAIGWTRGKIQSLTRRTVLLAETWDYYTVKPLILATLNFGVWVNLIILDPIILAFLLLTTLKHYSNFRGPLFSRTCQAREIREMKGTQKNWFYSKSAEGYR